MDPPLLPQAATRRARQFSASAPEKIRAFPGGALLRVALRRASGTRQRLRGAPNVLPQYITIKALILAVTFAAIIMTLCCMMSESTGQYKPDAGTDRTPVPIKAPSLLASTPPNTPETLLNNYPSRDYHKAYHNCDYGDKRREAHGDRNNRDDYYPRLQSRLQYHHCLHAVTTYITIVLATLITVVTTVGTNLNAFSPQEPVRIHALGIELLLGTLWLVPESGLTVSRGVPLRYRTRTNIAALILTLQGWPTNQ